MFQAEPAAFASVYYSSSPLPWQAQQQQQLLSKQYRHQQSQHQQSQHSQHQHNRHHQHQPSTTDAPPGNRPRPLDTTAFEPDYRGGGAIGTGIGIGSAPDQPGSGLVSESGVVAARGRPGKETSGGTETSRSSCSTTEPAAGAGTRIGAGAAVPVGLAFHPSPAHFSASSSTTTITSFPPSCSSSSSCSSSFSAYTAIPVQSVQTQTAAALLLTPTAQSSAVTDVAATARRDIIAHTARTQIPAFPAGAVATASSTLTAPPYGHFSLPSPSASSTFSCSDSGTTHTSYSANTHANCASPSPSSCVAPTSSPSSHPPGNLAYSERRHVVPVLTYTTQTQTQPQPQPSHPALAATMEGHSEQDQHSVAAQQAAARDYQPEYNVSDILQELPNPQQSPCRTRTQRVLPVQKGKGGDPTFADVNLRAMATAFYMQSKRANKCPMNFFFSAPNNRHRWSVI